MSQSLMRRHGSHLRPTLGCGWDALSGGSLPVYGRGRIKSDSLSFIYCISLEITPRSLSVLEASYRLESERWSSRLSRHPPRLFRLGYIVWSLGSLMIMFDEGVISRLFRCYLVGIKHTERMQLQAWSDGVFTWWDDTNSPMLPRQAFSLSSAI